MEGFIRLSLTPTMDERGIISHHINNVISSFGDDLDINEVLHLMHSTYINNTIDTTLFWDRGNWDEGLTWL